MLMYVFGPVSCSVDTSNIFLIQYLFYLDNTDTTVLCLSGSSDCISHTEMFGSCSLQWLWCICVFENMPLNVKKCLEEKSAIMFKLSMLESLLQILEHLNLVFGVTKRDL